MEQDYADTIKQLVTQYYNHEINYNDYRLKRKQIIDLMDDEFNGSNYYALSELLLNKGQTDNH